MDFRLLGPLEVVSDGRPLALGGTKQRAVLALLALHANESVSTDRLIDALWGESAPSGAVQSVRVHVSRLRKALAGARSEGDAPSVLVTTSGGYLLRVDEADLDFVRFEHALDEGRKALGDGWPDQAARLLERALDEWRGDALADLAFEPFAQAEVARLEELRVVALESRIDAELQLGRHAVAGSGLERLIAEHPLRERLRYLQMLALYRAGRQAEALEAYRKARTRLVDEIGVEPGPELRELHEAILRQDPALDPAVPPEAPAAPGSLPARPSRPGRRVAAPLAVGAAAVAIALFATGLLAGEDDADATIAENSVGVLEPEGGALRSQIPVGNGPGPAAADADSVWVANTLDDTVSRVEIDSGQVATIDVGGEPAGIATGAGFTWVADATEGTIDQIDPRANRIVGSIAVGNAPRGVAVAFGAVWVPTAVDGELVRIDLGRGKVTDRIPVGTAPSAITAGADALWVANEQAGVVVRVEPGSRRVSQAIAVGNAPSAIAFGEGAVWVTNRVDGTISRIDPETNAVTSTVEVGASPTAIGIGEGAAWVANAGDGTVARLPPDGGEVERAIDVGGSPSGLAVAAGAVWTSVRASPESHRGGTLSVELPAGYLSCGCIDPASYEFGSFVLAATLYDGLTAYRRVGGAAGSTLVGNLATEVPEPSDDGLTYVFQLRSGLRFSDGTEVDPDDFRSSIERMLQVNTGLDASYLYQGIVGAARCAEPQQPCDLSAGIETDHEERTVTIHLNEPDADFPARLALPPASVLPSDSPLRVARATPLPGTGPYVIGGFDRDQQAVELVRNPEFEVWSSDARPDGFPDRIDLEVAATTASSEDQLDRVLAGEADMMIASGLFGGPLSPEQITRLTLRHADLVHSAALPQVEWMFLNIRRPPFDDVRVRRALNYAADRGHIVELAGGPELAQPTCQGLAPGLPGYESYCPYTLAPIRPGPGPAPTSPRPSV